MIGDGYVQTFSIDQREDEFGNWRHYALLDGEVIACCQVDHNSPRDIEEYPRASRWTLVRAK